MTYEEAIEYLKIAKDSYALNLVWTTKEAIDLAIESLKKQVPMKPKKEIKTEILSGSIYPFEFFYCPNCGEEVYYSEGTNCDKCGQRLDWSDVND